MNDADFDAKLAVQVLGQMLGAIDGAVLTTRATKAEHQGGETSLDVATNVGIGQFIDRVEEGENLAVVLQEADDWLVEPRQLLIGLIAARIVG